MDGTCAVEGCPIVLADARSARGWCHNHYMGFYMHGPCQVEGCSRPARTKASGICRAHWPTACVIEGCEQTPGEDGKCRYHRRRFADPNRTCKFCGENFTGDKRSSYCSRACRDNNRRSPMRAAILSGDSDAIVAAAKQGSDETLTGCWEWRGARNPRGYAVGCGAGLIHRRVLAAVLGKPLGGRPVHHKCANPGCLNPEHLQLTNHRDNTAEMFQRRQYLTRIAELEAALMDVSPNHPALA